MPKYVAKNETIFFGEERTVIRQEATGAEIAGAALGLALAARQKAVERGVFRVKGEFDAAFAKGVYEDALRIANSPATNGGNRDIRGIGEYLKARALRYLGRPEEAVKAATAATLAWEVSSDPDAQMVVNYVQCELGWASLMAGDAPTAISAFTRAIKIVPEDQEAFNGRGVALRRLGNYDQSLHDLDRAIQIDPGQVDHYVQRGLTHLEMGNSQRSLADFVQATRLAPKDPTGYRHLGKLYTSLGDYEKAIEAYSHALSLEPRDVETRQERVEVYRIVKDEEKARADIATIEAQDRQAKAFEAYRNASDAIYDRGVTKSTKSFEVIKRDQRRYLLSIGILSLVAVITLLYIFISTKFTTFGGGPACLLFLVFFGYVITIPRYMTSRSEPKRTQQYIDEMSDAERNMPGFTEFYRLYLEARNKTELSKLEQNTQSLFAEGSAAHGFVTAEH